MLHTVFWEQDNLLYPYNKQEDMKIPEPLFTSGSRSDVTEEM